MNLIYLATLIAGFVIMISTSINAVDAEKLDNVCIWLYDQETVACKKELVDGQHILFNIEPAPIPSQNPSCHYSVHELQDFWIFQGRHGPTNNDKFDCERGFLIDKDSVTIRSK